MTKTIEHDMNKKHIVLAALLSATSLVTSAAEAPKLSLHRNNIKVWTYQTENNPVFQY